MLDDEGNTLSLMQYLPYGETFVQRGDLNFSPKFNSQELDRESGFYFFNARFYDPGIARFTSADIPNDEEEDNRRLCTEQENWTRQLTQSKNRLHSLFTQAGLTHITKKHLRTKANREISVALLPSRYQKEAERILKVLDLVFRKILGFFFLKKT